MSGTDVVEPISVEERARRRVLLECQRLAAEIHAKAKLRDYEVTVEEVD